MLTSGLVKWISLLNKWARSAVDRCPLAVMLRIHCVQLCYNLSDLEMEGLLYEAESARRFCELNLSGPIPYESTVLHFRHLLEQHELGQALFKTINAHLAVEAVSGLTHSLSTTAANTADVTEAHRLLRGDEREAWGDAGYQGAERRPEYAGSAVEWRVAIRHGRRRQLARDSPLAQRERKRASLPAKVEHPFLYIKRRFGYDQVRYRGLAKNHNRLALLFGFTNLLVAEPQLA